MTQMKEQLLDLSYWQDLNPHLHITQAPAFTAPLTLSQERLEAISDTLHHDGYLHQGPVFEEKDITPLRLGIETLVAHGWPPAFIYVYDESWNLFHKLSTFLSHFLGDFALLPHFWAWHVAPDPKGSTSGWPPHVDYPGECAFFDDYLISLSLWIPLSDATAENGCMNILPLSRQKEYASPIKEPEDILLQDVRCLPAKAGSLLGWRQDLWHWSGRSSKYARDPRISLSLEFQNRAFDPLCPPLYDLQNPPLPQERLRLVLGQFKKYDHMERVTPELEELGRELGITQT